jgi:GT2 family glycosyltransferase
MSTMAIATEVRRRLGPVPEAADWPLVSIVVLNRDGAGMLRRLLEGLIEQTDYPGFELVLIDNGSSDDSLDFIRRVEAPFPISIVANPHNESFSDACNQGAELASGELLLFLNNDVEPFEPGWLRELVACLRGSGAGAVAATLVCMDEEHEASFRYGYGIQHRGLAFREEGGMIHPVLHGWESDPLDEYLGVDEERGAVAAACVLVERGAYERVGGFTHGYVYGAEDIDLCLKLRAAGLRVLCSGRSVAIHHPVSTRRAAPFEEERARKLANRRVLWERWGPQLRREYELDRLERDGVWPLGFCIKAADPAAASELEAVGAALERRGHRCLLLEGDRSEDPIGLNYDVAVHLRGRLRYVPKPAQLNVLWEVAPPGTVPAIERTHYDLVLSGAESPERFAGRLLAAAEARIAEPGFRWFSATAARPSPAAGPAPAGQAPAA